MKYDEETIVTQDPKIFQTILEIGNRICSTDELLKIGIKSNLKEYLLATDKNIYIYKTGFMTGNTFGESVFRINYSKVSAIEFRRQFGGAGFIEIIANGVNNTNASYWSNKEKVNASEVENCFSFGRGGADIFLTIYNKLQDLHVEYTTPKENGIMDEIFITLKKYKKLLDEGIITQEDFDKVKSEILPF